MSDFGSFTAETGRVFRRRWRDVLADERRLFTSSEATSDCAIEVGPVALKLVVGRGSSV